MNIILHLRFLIIVSLVSLISCERDYVCTCSTTDGSIEVIINNAREKEAEEVCTERAEKKVLGAEASSCRLSGKYKRGES